MTRLILIPFLSYLFAYPKPGLKKQNKTTTTKKKNNNNKKTKKKKKNNNKQMKTKQPHPKIKW